MAASLMVVVGGCFADRLYRGLQPTPIPVEPTPEGLASVSAQTCRACHTEIYEEWSASGMGQAFTDPVFQADWAHQRQFYYCLSCHAPLEAQQPTRVTGLSSIAPPTPIETPNPHFSAALQQEGVTCVACHLQAGAMVGPHEVMAPHPTRADPSFSEAKTCERCHQMPDIPFTRSDRPLTDTHAEWEEWKRITQRTETCTDCHMPPVERSSAPGAPVRQGRRHTFPGGWSDELVRSAVDVGSPVATPRGLEVTLRNLSGHRLPSGEPGRSLQVRAAFRDTEGRVIGEVVHAIERRVRLPSGKELGDNTLLPAEERTIVLEYPDGLQPARASVVVEFDRLANLGSAHHLKTEKRVVEVRQFDMSI